LILGSAACAPGARWERPSATEADRRRDETECTSLASRDRSIPVPRNMSSSSTRAGRDGIELATVRDFEPGVFDECMRTRGYERIPVRPPS
jgi:hypothetical protein